MADAWQDYAVTMLRAVIGDLSSTPDYSSERLEELLCVAALYVVQEVEFDNTYSVDIPSLAITPDPVTKGELEFINFFVLKAACMLDQSNMRVKAATAGLHAKLGPAELRTLNQSDGYKLLMEQGACSSYKELLKQYRFGNRRYVRAVLSPFVSNLFSTFNYPASNDR